MIRLLAALVTFLLVLVSQSSFGDDRRDRPATLGVLSDSTGSFEPGSPADGSELGTCRLFAGYSLPIAGPAFSLENQIVAALQAMNGVQAKE